MQDETPVSANAKVAMLYGFGHVRVRCKDTNGWLCLMLTQAGSQSRAHVTAPISNYPMLRGRYLCVDVPV